MKKTIFTILRLVVSLGLIVYLLLSLNLQKVLSITAKIWEDRPDCLITVFSGALLLMFLEAYRLQQILKVQGIRLPLLRLVRYCFIGMFFNNFLPTTIGGDVVKGYYISRDSGRPVEPYVALFVVRIIGAVCLTLIALSALVIGYRLLPNKLPGLVLLFILLAAGFAVIFFTRKKIASKFLFILKPIKSKVLRRKVLEVYRIFYSHQHFPGQIALATGTTVGIEFLFILLNYVVVRGLGFTSVSFTTFLLLVPLIAVATLLPSLNGLGVREGAYVYFFSPLIGTEAAGALSFIMLIMIIFLGLAGGLVYLISASLDKARPRPPDPGVFEKNMPLGD